MMYGERMNLFPSVLFAMGSLLSSRPFISPSFSFCYLWFLILQQRYIWNSKKKKPNNNISLSILKNVFILKALRTEMVNLPPTPLVSFFFFFLIYFFWRIVDWQSLWSKNCFALLINMLMSPNFCCCYWLYLLNFII